MCGCTSNSRQLRSCRAYDLMYTIYVTRLFPYLHEPAVSKVHVQLSLLQGGILLGQISKCLHVVGKIVSLYCDQFRINSMKIKVIRRYRRKTISFPITLEFPGANISYNLLFSALCIKFNTQNLTPCTRTSTSSSPAGNNYTDMSGFYCRT